MKKYIPKIGIAQEGYPSIGLCAFTAIFFALLECPVLALVFLFLLYFSCHFFRDPERVIPSKAEGIAVCPADGKIISVSEKTDPISGEQKQCIAIFMNVFNVHVNRSPVEGIVKEIAYHPGKFLNASLAKASSDNERCAYLIEDRDAQQWTMVQIAGLIARRIVCGVDVGSVLERGERYGMIKFGSRVDVYVPNSYKASVSVGDKVLAGQTILAHKLSENK